MLNFKTGFNKIDSKIKTGDLIFIASKSRKDFRTLMERISFLNIMNNLEIGYISLEEEGQNIANRIYKNAKNDSESKKINKNLKISEGNKNIEVILKIFDNSKNFGIKIFFIDYMQIIQERSIFSFLDIRKIKNEAKKNDIIVIIGWKIDNENAFKMIKDKELVIEVEKNSENKIIKIPDIVNCYSNKECESYSVYF